MQTRVHVLVAAVFFGATSLATAQQAPDPSGHWQGAIHVPNQEIAIEIDLTKPATGNAAGTFTGVNIQGFPLSDIVVDGAALSFKLKVDGGGAFSAKVSEDGKSMAGEFTTNSGGYTLPFNLARSGDAKFDPPTPSAKMAKELEGNGTGTLEVNGKPVQVTLSLANGPDGLSSGTMAVIEQGAVDIPVSAIRQSATGVTIDVTVVKGSFSG